MPHRKVGPHVPEVRDGFAPEAVVPFSPEECAKIARSTSSMPALRRPRYKTPANSTSRTDAAYLD
jgi:hypothetical protein